MPEILDLRTVSHDAVIRKTVAVLTNGGIVVYPTDTIYGMGVDATNQKAVDKLLAYRNRPEGKPISIAVSSPEMAEEYVELNSIARNLFENFLPGPITVISHTKGTVAHGLASERGTLGVRMPDYPMVREICYAFGKPITTTSAVASYKKRPYTIQDVLDTVSEKQRALIDLILDAGELPKNEPSTVVDTTLNQEVVLRQGALKLTDIMERKTVSPEETQALGVELMNKYTQYLGYKSVIFALQGELGAGKTEMTKGIARALGIRDSISSPTFIIEKEYPLVFVQEAHEASKKIKLFHIDTWRLFDAHELSDLGFEKHVEEGNVFVIEWADKVQGLLESVSSDAVIVWVKLAYEDSLTERSISVSDFLN